MPTMTKLFGAFILLATSLASPFLLASSNGDLVTNTELAPFNASYDLYRRGDKLGKGSRSLTRTENNQYSIELSSQLSWFIFSDKRWETSQFSIQNQQVLPSTYSFKREGTGRDKSLQATFHPDKTLELLPESDDAKLADKQWQAGWLDEMSMFMQLQLDLIAGKTEFSYQVVTYRGELRTYNLKLIGKETIQTGMGELETIKVERIYPPERKKSQYAWFAPTLGHTLVRLRKVKKGSEEFDLVLKSFSFQKSELD